MSPWEGPLEAYDSRAAAEQACVQWAAVIVAAGLAGRYGAYARCFRTGRTYWHWGVFVAELAGEGASEQREAGR